VILKSHDFNLKFPASLLTGFNSMLHTSTGASRNVEVNCVSHIQFRALQLHKSASKNLLQRLYLSQQRDVSSCMWQRFVLAAEAVQTQSPHLCSRMTMLCIGIAGNSNKPNFG
jgi:hypothetical protein